MSRVSGATSSPVEFTLVWMIVALLAHVALGLPGLVAGIGALVVALGWSAW